MNTPAPAKSRLVKFGEMIQRACDELTANQSELERRYAEAEQLQRTHNDLNRELDRCSEQLVIAEGQFETFKAELAETKKCFLDAWGNPAVIGGPNYRQIVMLEAAIADFPRVRQHILAKVEAAKAALTDFEQEHL